MNKWIVVLLALVLTGCVRQHFRGDYGYSVANNSEVQTISPEAGNVDRPIVTGHGAKLDAGYNRYLQDDGTVEEGRVVDDVGSD